MNKDIISKNNAGCMQDTQATGVFPGTFQGESLAAQSEINALISDVVNDSDLEVDRFGTIRATSGDGLQSTQATGVSPGSFQGESLAAQSEISMLMQAVSNDSQIFVDKNGTVHGYNLSGLQATALTGICEGDFAAQWYETNKRLYDAEVKLMKKRFPEAKEGRLSNGNMTWQIRMNISKTDAFEPWTFLLIYKPDHPNNHGYGGSIKVIPLKPSYEELQKRVLANKRRFFTSDPPVPHIVIDPASGIKYLCTRAEADIESGETSASSAVQVAAWAAEWALYFELSMRDNKVWNKWVDDNHFRKWKIDI